MTKRQSKHLEQGMHKLLSKRPFSFPDIKFNKPLQGYTNFYSFLRARNRESLNEGFIRMNLMSISHAPSSSGKCSVCQQRIVKGTPRGKMKLNRLFCYDHAIERLSLNRQLLHSYLEECTKDLKILKRMSQMKGSLSALQTQDMVRKFEESSSPPVTTVY